MASLSSRLGWALCATILGGAGRAAASPPDPGAFDDLLRRSVADGLVESAPVSVTLSVNSRPVGGFDSYATPEDTPLVVDA